LTRQRALIGSTGFVGGVLQRHDDFSGLFHSSNVEELPEREWDEVVCAGMPAEKWRANKEPDDDEASLEALWGALGRTATRRVVLISTVDVFDPPRNKDESREPDAAHPYGRNRARLETRLAERFEDTAIVRLPALYGPGLKKNALYDLLVTARSPAPRDAVFQWYDLERLPEDLDRMRASNLRVANLVSEPVSMGEVIDRCFAGAPAGDGTAAQYDLRTRHAELFGGRNGYLEDSTESLNGVARFVERVRSGEVECVSRSR
jgi:hypothetical protein